MQKQFEQRFRYYFVFGLAGAIGLAALVRFIRELRDTLPSPQTYADEKRYAD